MRFDENPNKRKVGEETIPAAEELDLRLEERLILGGFLKSRDPR
jgi:hypothetical protein